MRYMNNLKTRDEVSEWAETLLPESLGPYAAVTLTFNTRFDDLALTSQKQEAIKNFTVFDHILNSDLFGKSFARHKKIRLGVLPIIEGGSAVYSKRFHYHAIYQIPPNVSLEYFEAVCAAAWRSTKYGINGNLLIESCHDDGWLSYILKLRDKPDSIQEAMDVQNIRKASDLSAFKAF